MSWPKSTGALQKQILTLMASLGTCTQRQLCDGLGFTQGRVSWLVRTAIDQGLVRKIKDVFPVQYEVVPGWEVVWANVPDSGPGERPLLQPPPAIDWRLIYNAWGINPP